jgi:hypothetical protein
MLSISDVGVPCSPRWGVFDDPHVWGHAARISEGAQLAVTSPVVSPVAPLASAPPETPISRRAQSLVTRTVAEPIGVATCSALMVAVLLLTLKPAFVMKRTDRD